MPCLNAVHLFTGDRRDNPHACLQRQQTGDCRTPDRGWRERQCQIQGW